MRRTAIFLAWVLTAWLPATATLAQSFPSKPIQLVTASTGGGLPDLFARIIAEKLAADQQWRVLVINKPGAGGILATESVAKASPDGYTLLLGDSGSLAINPALNPNLPYDVLKDFAPIAQLVELPTFLCVTAALPIHSVKDLVSYAKANPGTNYGSSGIGSVTHLSMELLRSLTGISLTHVPYKGVAASVPALATGEVSMMFSGYPAVRGQVEAGRIRVLAVSGPRRVSSKPDIPTVAEAGIAGYELSTTFGVLAPAGTPVEIVRVLNKALSQVLKDKATRDRVLALGLEPTDGDGPAAQYGETIRGELEKFRKLVKDTGAKAG